MDTYGERVESLHKMQTFGGRAAPTFVSVTNSAPRGISGWRLADQVECYAVCGGFRAERKIATATSLPPLSRERIEHARPPP
jgi:hypothetical protein